MHGRLLFPLQSWLHSVDTPTDATAPVAQLEGIAEAERGDLSRLLARVRYLRRVGQPEAGRLIDWNRPRINRLVIDYLLRRGYRQSALHLIQTSGPGVSRPCGKGDWERAQLGSQASLRMPRTGAHVEDRVQGGMRRPHAHTGVAGVPA